MLLLVRASSGSIRKIRASSGLIIKHVQLWLLSPSHRQEERNQGLLSRRKRAGSDLVACPNLEVLYFLWTPVSFPVPAF